MLVTLRADRGTPDTEQVHPSHMCLCEGVGKIVYRGTSSVHCDRKGAQLPLPMSPLLF